MRAGETLYATHGVDLIQHGTLLKTVGEIPGSTQVNGSFALIFSSPPNVSGIVPEVNLAQRSTVKTGQGGGC